MIVAQTQDNRRRFDVVCARKFAVNTGRTACADIRETVAVHVRVLLVVHLRLIHDLGIGLADVVLIHRTVAVIVAPVTDLGRWHARTRIAAEGHVVHRVRMGTVLVDHEMKMRPRRTASRAHDADLLAAFDVGSFRNAGAKRFKMKI